MMAKPRLALFPFHSYSYLHRLFHPRPCTSSPLSYTCTTIHRFLISPSVTASLGTYVYMLFLELFDKVLMTSTKIHSLLQTLTHNLTPPCLHVKLPLKIPSFPLYPNSIPIYPILYAFLRKLINQSSGGVSR